MMTCSLFVLLSSGIALGQTFSVCEALSKSSALNGKNVSIEGVWRKGDVGQQLWSPAPCTDPTVRDGWQFADVIKVEAGGENERVTEFYRRLRALAKAHPGTNIVATLTGRFEAPDHFETVSAVPGAPPRPRAFGPFAARIIFESADSFKSVPSDPKAELEVRGRVEPRRVK